MSVQLAIELYAVASLCSLAAVVALFLKAYWPAPEVRTLARPQLNALLEAPLRADSSVRNVVPVTKQELSEIDQMIDALLTLEPRPTTLARMKPVSKRVM